MKRTFTGRLVESNTVKEKVDCFVVSSIFSDPSVSVNTRGLRTVRNRCRNTKPFPEYIECYGQVVKKLKERETPMGLIVVHYEAIK